MKDNTKNTGRLYFFQAYNPLWKDRFAELKNLLEPIWKSAIAIEHIGSTSFPGASAKPVIDILIIVKNINEADFQREIHAMKLLGFTYMKDYIEPNSFNFHQTEELGNKINNVHICEQGSKKQRQFLITRDYFRKHPQIVQEYSELKQRNWEMYPDDYIAYRDAKQDFLKKVEQDAYTWFSALPINKDKGHL